MTSLGLCQVGAKQSVPPGEVEAEVAVRLPELGRVMHPMHVGCHDQPAEPAIEPLGQCHIAVVEQCRHVQQHFEQHDSPHCRSQGGDHAQLEERRQQDLERMKARPGGDVEIEVGVVHAMQPPESRDGMKQHMLQVDCQIEQGHGQHHFKPRRPGERGPESPATLGGQGRGPHGGDWQQPPCRHGVQQGQRQVVGPARPLAHCQPPPGTENFPGRHRDQDQQARSQADGHFERVVHDRAGWVKLLDGTMLHSAVA